MMITGKLETEYGKYLEPGYLKALKKEYIEKYNEYAKACSDEVIADLNRVYNETYTEDFDQEHYNAWIADRFNDIIKENRIESSLLDFYVDKEDDVFYGRSVIFNNVLIHFEII